MDILCLLIKQMEKTNQYLQEGFLEINASEFKEIIKGLDSKSALFKFLDLHYFKTGSGKSKILPIEETKQMINYLFTLIDNLEAANERDTSNFDWNQKSIYLNIEQTRKLLEYHTRFLNKVDQYYGGIKDSDGQILFRKSERIEGLVYYEPSERDLSSGEMALLNFYSRVYYYFKKQLIDIESIVKKDFYLILLDEADMGYHPKWKKSFVKSIVSFLPSFFKSLEAKIQIIFTTHDALTLSDIPNTQITYLDKIDKSNVILNEVNKPQKSFGANITDLLNHSFFIGDGLIGDFAKDKIQGVLNNLNLQILELEIEELKSKNFDEYASIIESKQEELLELKKFVILKESDYCKSIIDIVDEPILKFKMEEMYYKAYPNKIDKNDALNRAKRILGEAGLSFDDLNDSIS